MVVACLAVAGEVSPVSALVAPKIIVHCDTLPQNETWRRALPAVGVEALPAASAGAGQGEGDPDLPALDVGAVGHLAGLLRVVFVLVHHEGEAGRRPRHPDLAERPELAEGLLEVAFGRLKREDLVFTTSRQFRVGSCLGVQVGDVQTVSLLVAVAHGAAVAPVAVVPVGAPGPRVFRTPRPPPRVFHFNGISINEQFTLSFGKRRTNTRPSTARSDIIQMRNGASTKLGDHCSWEHFLNPNDRLLFIPSFI